MLQSLNLPTRTQLWNYAILSTIAHAISVAERGAYYGCEWSGPMTIFTNGCGDEGAITFGERGTVAVFFAHESERSAYGYENGEGYDIEQFFVGIPGHLRKYADEQKGCTAAQAQLLERLFHRRIKTTDHSIRLTEDDIAILRNHGKADLHASLEVLTYIGILYP